MSLMLCFNSSNTAALRLSSASPYIRGLDAVRASIEQPHTERVLKIGDRFRNGGLGNSKLLSRLRYAAALNGREERMQVPQLEAAANLTLPVDFSGHRQCSYRPKTK